MQYTRSCPAVPDYYLHGFDQLDGSSTLYDIIAATTSPGTYALLKHLLEDDRLGMSCMELDKLMVEKRKELECVGPYTWRRLSRLLPDKHPSFLQDKSLHAFHLAHAFVQKKVMQPTNGYPWKLLHGDREANLMALATADGLEDDLTSKVK